MMQNFSNKRRLIATDIDNDDDDYNYENNSHGGMDDNNQYNSNMDDQDGLPSDKRRSRNENEKKRRDQFNELIDELGILLNHEHKTDKSTTLLETLNFFKSYSIINDKNKSNCDTNTEWKPSFLKNDEFINLMCEFRSGFYLVFDLNGIIKYVSDNITNLLGYLAKDVIDQSLYNLIDEKSGKSLQSNLKKRKFNVLDKINFQIQWKKNNNFTINYQTVKINGFFKRSINGAETKGFFVTIASIDSFLRVNDNYLSNTHDREFTSEFSMDWKFKSLDNRAIQIIGYTAMEVLGTSGYDFYHVDDLESIIECHRILLKKSASTSSVYRFRTKGQQWIFLQSHYTLLFNTSNGTSEPYAVFCTNHLININDALMAKSASIPTTSSRSSSVNSQINHSIDQQNGANSPYAPASVASVASAGGGIHVSPPSSVKPSAFNEFKSYKKLDYYQHQHHHHHHHHRENSNSNSEKGSYNNNNNLILSPKITPPQSHQSIIQPLEPIPILPIAPVPVMPSRINSNDDMRNSRSSSVSSLSSIGGAAGDCSKQQRTQVMNSNSLANAFGGGSGGGGSEQQDTRKGVSKLILMSYQQPAFRKYVCTQLLLFKSQHEEKIRVLQEKVNQFDEIIKFFQDDEKLENWVAEVKKSLHQSSNSTSSEQSHNNNNNNNNSSSHSNSPSMSGHASMSQTLNHFNNHHHHNQNNNHHHHHHNIHTSPQANHGHQSSSFGQPQQQQQQQQQNTKPSFQYRNDEIDIDDIDAEVLDRLLGEYSFKSLIM